MNNNSNISDHVVSGREYKYSAFNRDNYNKFFLNDFMHYPNDYKLNGVGVTKKGFSYNLDIHGIYSHNSHGYRSKEFHKNTQAVFSGDSFTYGVGLPEDGTWASMVSEALGLDSVNLGFPGASATGIVSNLMHYFKVYGNPEYLFCMFPDLERMHVFLNKNILTSTHDMDNGFTEIQLCHLSDYEERPKYAKKPFLVDDVMSNEIAYYYSLKSIQMLEQYCEAAGIKFLWGMFHVPDSDAMRELVKNELGYYGNFLDTEQHYWNKDSNGNDVFYVDGNYENKGSCHLDQKEILGERFDIAGDIELGRDRAHHGIHRHIHTAEIFIEEIKRLDANSWDK